MDVCFQSKVQDSANEAPPFAILAYCVAVRQLRPCAQPAFSAVCSRLLCHAARKPEVLLSEQVKVLLGLLAVQSVLSLAVMPSAVCLSMC